MTQEIIAQIVMLVSAFLVGYGTCQLRHPVTKRDSRGRFVKRED